MRTALFRIINKNTSYCLHEELTSVCKQLMQINAQVYVSLRGIRDCPVQSKGVVNEFQLPVEEEKYG